ncbi:acyl-CoA carboxylase epsilon subunit [Streptomyces fuscichromogenes]|uniref:acyl-CoA carboxylase epsilon subunit n=1 Tax=Streptomyces fuscichromogenes TaxID=1324013 RepID=UPI003826D174
MNPPTPGTTELAAASLRVIRGTPTPEELAALAVLLTARLRTDGERTDTAGPLTPTLWRHPGAGFRPPGTWAS